ncbi:hypothetical protein DSO57_1019626 [Entomophthora muscae]|uniref:Uncharacterized protein n=1 Tax=Entomophthora muscae TaxID=34485 RepID=A0ACC2STL3_9FUNG|nr:hypothetical protein DSO57_1019626 [Entomophthora muscae]
MATTSDQLKLYHTALKNIGSQADQIKDKISGGLEKVKNGKLQTDLGISLLDVKYRRVRFFFDSQNCLDLLLDYMTNLSFYSLLKAQGKSVEGHPVILKLIELRTHIEKLKPVEAKLKYQIDKLVRASNIGATKESTALLGII